VFVHGVVLESARGSVPNLAETIAGGPIRGSYWNHPNSHEIFRCTRSLRASADVLVCRLVGGKVTFVHRRLWPAIVRLAERFKPDRIGAIREVHSPSGKHEVHSTAYPDWVTPDVRRAAEVLTVGEAESMLAMVPELRQKAQKPPERLV